MGPDRLPAALQLRPWPARRNAATSGAVHTIPPQGGGRMPGIDVFRLLAFIGVVLIHTASARDDDPRSLGQAIVALSRFAVPYFFIASGYFLRDLSFRKTIAQLAKRLLPAFLAWGMLYCWLFEGSLVTLAHPKTLARFLYTGLPAYHLWFLPALASAVILFSAMKPWFGWKGRFAVAGALYGAGLLLGPLHPVFGITLLPVGTRNGPWFALLFVTIGAWWRTRAVQPIRVPVLVAGVLLAGAAQLAENLLLLDSGVADALSGPDFTIMTLPFGVAVFALARAWPTGAATNRIATVGRAAFGMYLVHAAMIYLIQGIMPPVSLEARLGDAGVAIATSIGVALVMARIPVVRRLVG